jgi:hypothetical protein
MAFTMGPSAEHAAVVPDDRRFCANASYNQQVRVASGTPKRPKRVSFGQRSAARCSAATCSEVRCSTGIEAAHRRASQLSGAFGLS